MKFCLDRFEGKQAVCLCEDEGARREPYVFAVSENPALENLTEGMLFEADLVDDGHVKDVVALPTETEDRLARATARLHALAARAKKNRES
jgi:DNA/RNA-binding domain of Phe-tRNA-synthetase-like protein